MGIYLAPRLKRFYLEQKLTTKDKQAPVTEIKIREIEAFVKRLTAKAG